MADNRILTFYPPLNGSFDIIAGLKIWNSRVGRLQCSGVTLLEPFDSETYLEPVSRDYQALHKDVLDSLRPIIELSDIKLMLNAPWYPLEISVTSYHHADPPIMFWSFDRRPWGMGTGGVEEAEAGLLNFSRAIGAAYVLAVDGLGHEVTRRWFVSNGTGYRFVQPTSDSYIRERILWVDVCSDLGGIDSFGVVKSNQHPLPFGCNRHILTEKL